MNYYERSDNCLYNPIHVKFNEDLSIGSTFSSSLQYPSFFTLRNSYFNVSQNVLNNINSTIKSDVFTFKNGLIDEEIQVNDDNNKNNNPEVKYRVITNYANTFSKNHILSTIVNLMAFVDEKIEYNELNNYNFDLLTGNMFTIGNVFNPNVDYLKVISNYVNYKISQNKELYYKDVVVDIPEDQAFYSGVPLFLSHKAAGSFHLPDSVFEPDILYSPGGLPVLPQLLYPSSDFHALWSG